METQTTSPGIHHKPARATQVSNHSFAIMRSCAIRISNDWPSRVQVPEKPRIDFVPDVSEPDATPETDDPPLRTHWDRDRSMRSKAQQIPDGAIRSEGLRRSIRTRTGSKGPPTDLGARPTLIEITVKAEEGELRNCSTNRRRNVFSICQCNQISGPGNTRRHC
jgi:hypothetical protein